MEEKTDTTLQTPSTSISSAEALPAEGVPHADVLLLGNYSAIETAYEMIFSASKSPRAEGHKVIVLAESFWIDECSDAWKDAKWGQPVGSFPPHARALAQELFRNKPVDEKLRWIEVSQIRCAMINKLKEDPRFVVLEGQLESLTSNSYNTLEIKLIERNKPLIVRVGENTVILNGTMRRNRVAMPYFVDGHYPYTPTGDKIPAQLACIGGGGQAAWVGKYSAKWDLIHLGLRPRGEGPAVCDPRMWGDLEPGPPSPITQADHEKLLRAEDVVWEIQGTPPSKTGSDHLVKVKPFYFKTIEPLNALGTGKKEQQSKVLKWIEDNYSMTLEHFQERYPNSAIAFGGKDGVSVCYVGPILDTTGLPPVRIEIPPSLGEVFVPPGPSVPFGDPAALVSPKDALPGASHHRFAFFREKLNLFEKKDLLQVIDTISLVMTMNEVRMLCSRLECADFADTLVAAIRKLPDSRSAQKGDGTTADWIVGHYTTWLSSQSSSIHLPKPEKLGDLLHEAQLKVLRSVRSVLDTGTSIPSDDLKSSPRRGPGLFDSTSKSEPNKTIRGDKPFTP